MPAWHILERITGKGIEITRWALNFLSSTSNHGDGSKIIDKKIKILRILYCRVYKLIGSTFLFSFFVSRN